MALKFDKEYVLKRCFETGPAIDTSEVEIK